MSQPDSCPICGKPGTERFRPFCSKRCADIDLGTWFKGGYVVPGSEAEASDPAKPDHDEEE